MTVFTVLFPSFFSEHQRKDDVTQAADTANGNDGHHKNYADVVDPH